MRDDYDDEYNEDDGGLIVLLLALLALWGVVAVVMWALR